MKSASMRSRASRGALGVLAAVVAVAAAGCESVNTPRTIGCPIPVRATVSPGDTVILVGTVFTPRLSLIGCTGESVTEVASFVAADTSIISVNANDGRTGGKASGESDVFVYGERYGLLTRFHIIVQVPK